MGGEQQRPGRGSSQVGAEKQSREIISVEPAQDGEGAEDARIVEVPEGEAALAPGAEGSEPEDSGPLTLGDLAGGARSALDDVSTHARRLIDRGRYRKLRISRKGKQVLPDIPIAAAAAIEAASMYGAGIARVLAVNVGARFLFDVEVVNEADEYVERGKAAVLDGDLERALEALEKAVRMDDTHAGAFLQLGVLYRLRGQLDRARTTLSHARSLDENGEIGRRAEEILRALGPAKGA